MLIRAAIENLPRYKPGVKAKREMVTPDGRPIARMNANEGPWPPFQDAIDAMTSALTDLNTYPDQSYAELKIALGELHGLDPATFVVGNGSGSLIRLLTLVTLEPGDEAILPWPPYPAHAVAVHLMGGHVVRSPLVDGSADLDGVLGLITNRTRLVLICSPHNPTGGIVTRAAFEAYLDRVPDHVITLLDQAYQEYVDDPEAADGLAYLDRDKPVVVFRTFSKIYGMAGLRAGYAAAAPRLAEAMGKATETFPLSHVGVVAAVASIRRQDLVRERAQLNAEERRTMAAAIAERGFDASPSHANFLWIDVRRNAKEVADALLARGIQIRSGEVHDAPQYIRVTIGLPDQNRAFLAALDDVLTSIVEAPGT
jgi:histidinol-phosphate aminotransferase